MSSWSSHDAVRARVTELLRDSGALLEHRVGEICRQYASAHRTDELRIFSERVIYSDGRDDQTPREIDQCVSISDIRTVGCLELFHEMRIPIECKHRDGTQIVAVAEGNKYRRLYAPMVSTLGCNSFLFPLIPTDPSEPNPLSPVASDVVLLEFKDDMTPKGIHKEQIVSNAAAALYDFVRYDFQGYCSERDVSEEEALNDLGLKTQLEAIAGTRPYFVRRHKVLTFVESLPDDIHDRFNELCGVGRHGGFAVQQHVCVAIPVVCMDGPLYLAEVQEDGEIRYSDVPFVVMPVRVRQWLSALEHGLVLFAPEQPVIVTTPDGLERVLELCTNLYEMQAKYFSSQPYQTTKHVPLLSAADRFVGRFLPKDFRSDLGLGHLEKV